MNEKHRRALELGLVLARMDAVNRADVDAGCIFRSDAGIGGYEWHEGSLRRPAASDVGGGKSTKS